MPSDRRWSDADEALAARAITAVYGQSRTHSPLGMGRAVLDALTAAGWRPAREFLPVPVERFGRSTVGSTRPTPPSPAPT